MVIFKDDKPYFVEEIEDLAELMGEDVFEQVKDYIEENYVSKIERLEEEIDGLESEVGERADEVESLKDDVEYLQEKCDKKYERLKSAVSDYLDVLDESVLDKNQTYYFDKLVEALKEN
nr:hypothetical protein [uncultured Cellulosilyticum sp.]